MGKFKYYYNPSTLSYEKVEKSLRQKMLRVFGFIATSVVSAGAIVTIAFTLFSSPMEKQLEAENKALELQYKLLSRDLDQLSNVLGEMQERDDNIYRVIFEAEPIPSSIRNMGVGGGSRYKEFEKYKTGDLIIETTKNLKKLQKQLYVQSRSYDEIAELVKNKQEMLASIPAIQPVSNKDLKRVASGYGWRTDPFYKTKKFHAGLDFSAPEGTPIYATGDGKVIKAHSSRYRNKSGLGNNIKIQHGFGYQTIFGHLSKLEVKKGQKVKRGQVIGYVGNTGKSTAPHLHYEVVKNNRKVNPVDFFYNDLTPDQFEKMIEMAQTANQSFD